MLEVPQPLGVFDPLRKAIEGNDDLDPSPPKVLREGEIGEVGVDREVVVAVVAALPELGPK